MPAKTAGRDAGATGINKGLDFSGCTPLPMRPVSRARPGAAAAAPQTPRAEPGQATGRKAGGATDLAGSRKNLVIVESPGKIKTISKVLGSDFVVKASIGHVRDLPEKQSPGPGEALVLGVARDFTPTYVTLPNRRKVLDELKRASDQAEKVFLCPDPDREGEAIAWHLKEALHLSAERTFRVTFDEITPRGIRAGFSRPRELDQHLVNAQQARRVLDRIVGYKLSPLLWKKIGRGLSAGRVQSVAVRLIVEREREIEAFKAEEYWTLTATFSFAGAAFEAELRTLEGKLLVASADDLARFKTNHVTVSGVSRILLRSEAEARALADALRAAACEVTNYEVREVADRPYPPFATSQLQQNAANRLGFDARRTMRVAQELYHGLPLGEQGHVALITYMRTDSFRISQDALSDARETISRRFGPQYLPEKPNFYASRKGGQEAHECIRPTHPELAPEDVKPYLNEDQNKLYRLIWQRFISCQMRPALFEAATCDIAARGEQARNAVFRATGRVPKFDGWLRVYGGAQAAPAVSHLDVPDKDKELGDEETEVQEEQALRKKKKAPQVLPPMKTGDRPDLKGLDPVQHFTQPPPRYTEASLVKTLEREGIGRPSTYASIISTIQDRGYVQKLGGGGRGPFQPTALGCAVNDRLVQFFDHSILNLGFTRQMESELDKIEEAHMDWRKVLDDFYRPFTDDLASAAQGMASASQEAQQTDVKCPQCGAPMIKRLSRYGPYLRCSKYPQCKGTQRLNAQGEAQEKTRGQPTGLKCDLCGGEVLRSVGRFGAYLHCVRYPKDCSYTMRLTKDGRPVRKFHPLPTDRVCGKCKSPLVVRVTARGKHRRAFLSCSKFPKCRAALDLPPELAPLGEQAMAQWRENDARNKADQQTYQSHAAQTAPGPATERDDRV
jgi:DNA topoisomerase-1